MWLRVGIPVVLVLLIVLCFMPALDASLVYWDDDDLLLHTTRYRTLDADSLRWMFSTSFAGHFQPLTWLSYWLDWTVWKRETFGFHLTSVVLHALTAVVFYFVARTLIALARGRLGAPHTKSLCAAAGFAAALFALHPLRAESVAWVAERRDVLAGFFYVLAVACYLRYATDRAAGLSPRDPSNCGTIPEPGVSARAEVYGSGALHSWAYAGAVGACTLSLLAKASAVTLPVVLLVLDVYPLRRWGIPRFLRRGRDWRGTAQEPWDTASRVDAPTYEPVVSDDSTFDIGHSTFETLRSRIWLEKLPFFGLALVAGIRAVVAQADAGALYGLDEHGLAARFAQACHGLVFYLWKTVWPSNLGPLYEIPPGDVLFGPGLWLSVLVLLVIAWVLKRFRHTGFGRAASAALVVYVVLLLPVLGFLQSGPQFVADRYSYLSCLGLAVLAGGALLSVAESRPFRYDGNRRWLLALPCAVLIAVLGRATFRQADVWLSAYTLWTRGVEVSPNSAVAHTNLADVLAVAGEHTGAAWHYRRALELDPRDAVALHHFGDLHRTYGHWQVATRLYLRSLRIDPNRKRACLSLARLLVMQGRPREAVTVLEDGARRHPEALDLIEYLAQVLASHPDANVRNGPEAVRWAAYVSQSRESRDPPSLLTLATAYAEAGRFEEAVDTATYALRLARQNGNLRLIPELERRTALFRRARPYHFAE